MTDTPKYFIYPFGTDGDRATVPNPTQVSGVLSYQEGFPVGYQLIDTDPASLNIPRDEFNQLVYDITLAIQQIQQNGFPVFITTAMNGGTAFPYEKNSFVRASNGNVYFSLIDVNTDTPPSSNWQLFINGNGSLSGGITTGMMLDYWGTALPTGYVWPNGQTIGNAASNATGLADASTADLFSFFWTLSSSIFPMFTSTGTPQARGVSAAADFAANYAITLPDCLERVTAGAGTMGGVADPSRITVGGAGISGPTLGASGGLQTVALATANLAAHFHDASSLTGGDHYHDGSGMTVASHTHSFSATTSSDGAHTHTANVVGTTTPGSGQVATGQAQSNLMLQNVTTSSAGAHTHSVSGTSGAAAPGVSGNTGNATVPIAGNTGSAGAGTAHQNTQPTIICNKIIKL